MQSNVNLIISLLLGFEILTKREQLADRETVDRLPPLTRENFQDFVDTEGRIKEVDVLKERIFKGGLHPNLRSQLWCYLLGYLDYNMTSEEVQEQKEKKEKEYYLMKQQWKTLSEIQENNFSGYKERKSIIGKSSLIFNICSQLIHFSF